MLIRFAAAVALILAAAPCHAVTPDGEPARQTAGERASLGRADLPSAGAGLSINARGDVFLQNIPEGGSAAGRVIGRSRRGDAIVYTVAPELHALAKKLVTAAHAPHVAAVAMEPATGRILAMAERSNTLPHALLHDRFPAASLFKIITGAAALETNTIQPMSPVKFRGGTYTLNESNYSLDPIRDRHSMSLSEAMGKSCNPVFAHVALKHLVPSRLRAYAERFGFNSDLKFDIPLHESIANIPGDNYEFSRTAAGFGDVSISPIHAAALIAAVANRDVLPRPYVVEKVIAADGTVNYEAHPQYLKRAVRPETAEQLLQMLEFTTTHGTSRNEFYIGKRPVLPGVRVAAKTGTLRGTNPLGLNKWFVAAAPLEHPQIVVAVIAVNPASLAARPARIGRLLIQKYLNVAPAAAPVISVKHITKRRAPVKPKRVAVKHVKAKQPVKAKQFKPKKKKATGKSTKGRK